MNKMMMIMLTRVVTSDITPRVDNISTCACLREKNDKLKENLNLYELNKLSKTCNYMYVDVIN